MHSRQLESIGIESGAHTFGIEISETGKLGALTANFGNRGRGSGEIDIGDILNRPKLESNRYEIHPSDCCARLREESRRSTLLSKSPRQQCFSALKKERLEKTGRKARRENCLVDKTFYLLPIARRRETAVPTL